MKKLFLFLLIFVCFTNLQGFSLTIKQIYESDVVTDENKKLKEIRKIPTDEKFSFARQYSIYPSDEEGLNRQILLLYLLPKTLYCDIPDIMEFVSPAGTNEDEFCFLKTRVMKDNFNLFFEKNLLGSIDIDENRDEVYELYDKFNSKLTSGNFDAANPEDKNLFLEVYKYIFRDGQSNKYIVEGRDNTDETDEFDEDRMRLLELYISLDEFNSPKVKGFYNIYRLEYDMLVNYNNYSAEFLRRKFKDANTNYANLCYFMHKVQFDIPMDAEIEKEFDAGLYNSGTNLLKSEYYLSQITGRNNKVVNYIKSKKITLTPEQRLEIINLRFYNYEKFAYQIIDTVVSSAEIPADKKSQVICKALKKAEADIFNYELDDMQRKWVKYLKESFETLP